MAGIGDAGGGLVERAPGSGARDGFRGAWEEGACAGVKRSAGAVLGPGRALCRGAGRVLGRVLADGLFAETALVPDASSCPLGSEGGGFTLAPLLPM